MSDLAQIDQPMRPRWTIVIAFYNEAAYLPATLTSIAAQTLRPLRAVLVDNGSTDDSVRIVEGWAALPHGVEVECLRETTPGQVHALAAGIAATSSDFVAIGDADTIYPPDYLARADAAFARANADAAALYAHDAGSAPHSWRERAMRRVRGALLVGLMRGQTYAGGYGHLFRTASLKAAGGYSSALWPYVLKDHELAYRVARHGRTLHDADLWVATSDRRTDRGGVRWTLWERLLYHATPFAAKDWFFYRYLGPRLAARGMKDTVLRKRSWDGASGS